MRFAQLVVLEEMNKISLHYSYSFCLYVVWY